VNNKFVFVVPYYNCQGDILKTVYSVMAQSYDDWRIILINDMSTDRGPQDITQLVVKDMSPDMIRRFTLVDNSEKHGEVRNTLEAIKTIEDDEVVCRLDGGDWLVDNDLLWILNQQYLNPKLAVAWTAHRWGYSATNISGKMNLDHLQVQNPTVYQHRWVSSHLKTFRCKHLRTVPYKNFLTDGGEHIMIACDQAVFLPMMHKSLLDGYSLDFIPIVGYHYNIDLSDKNLFTSERSINQKHSAEMIRARGYLE